MRSPSRIRSLGVFLPFLLIVCVLSSGLAWLGWRVLEQDRTLQNQRVLERLGAGADAAGTALLRILVEAEDALGQMEAAPESQWATRATAITGASVRDAVVVVFRVGRVDAFPPECLRYYPVTPAGAEAPPGFFARGEALEYRQRDPEAASSVYREVARSGDPTVRAEALIRLARALRKANRATEALDAYDELSALAPVRLGDVPAGLMARHARCTLLVELRRPDDLRSEASALVADLQSGRWRVTRAVYQFYLEDARRWSAAATPGQAYEPDSQGLAAGTSALWEEWLDLPRGERVFPGRRLTWADARPVLVVCRGTGDRLVGLIAGASFVEREWLSRLEPTLARLHVRLGLADADGRAVVAGADTPVGARIVRSPAESGLPWTLGVASADAGEDLAQLSARRRFVIAGFGLVVALTVVASYMTARAVSRELAVTRLQSDFVSAVSHEFRTPLASLRQVSEMLSDGRVPSEQRRLDYYEDLRHESERLHRLVENLLDFGRMEAGAREYRLELIDAVTLVRQVAEEFGREVAGRGYRVEVTTEDVLPDIRADREALTRALWNLLDNAVKYSPAVKTVWIDARAGRGRVLIVVRDEGLGLAPEERRRVFGKFVRGGSARAAAIKGTGLGLAMVQHIVAAHHGQVHVTSELGRGSTFTVVLPVPS